MARPPHNQPLRQPDAGATPTPADATRAVESEARARGLALLARQAADRAS
jgi:hypothetical protein